MKRQAEQVLAKWLKNPYRKPLIIRGARQVGKSTLVRSFARENGLKLFEVNLERHLKLQDVFKKHNTELILSELEYLCGQGPIDPQNSLVFLDEIQAVPVAIQTLRYFYEDRPELPVIAAGSLLEFALSKHSFSMPVGRVQYFHLGPVTFKEMLAAHNQMDLLELAEKYVFPMNFPVSAHDRFQKALKLYFQVGGMPEAVQRYIDTRDWGQVFDVHHSIIETYRDDFAKYASQSDLLRLHRVFDHVPLSVGNRMKYANIDPDDQARNLRRALDLLTKALVVIKAHHTAASGIPVAAELDLKRFKTYFMDCGLMNAMTGSQRISRQALHRSDFINKGRIAEQFIAQHLKYSGTSGIRTELTYWQREGRSSNAEIDFVVQYGNEIVPVEVKSGKSGTLKSMLQFVHQKKRSAGMRFDLNLPSSQEVRHQLRQKHESVEVNYHLLSLPLYLVEDASRIFNAWIENR